MLRGLASPRAPPGPRKSQKAKPVGGQVFCAYACHEGIFSAQTESGEGCDRIVVVIDPSYESVQLSHKISEMASTINKPVFFILNRMNEDSAELEALVDREKIAGVLPFNRDVFKACLKGSRVPEVEEMKQIVDRLLAS